MQHLCFLPKQFMTYSGRHIQVCIPSLASPHQVMTYLERLSLGSPHQVMIYLERPSLGSPHQVMPYLTRPALVSTH